ncbi:Uncharacterised protein [Candidatus Anstonella stagnisolia]|nr:Uncharacterised protein [Candidatus Anstonella stagnisolia]
MGTNINALEKGFVKKRASGNVAAPYAMRVEQGLTEEHIAEISHLKGEPDWMLQKRLESFRIYRKKPMPTWGADLSALDIENIWPYIKPEGQKTNKWEEVPSYIKDTFDKLGIPEAEKKFLAGVGAMYDSETRYFKIRKDLEAMGVIFVDTDTAVQEYPELVKEYFMTKCVPAADNKFSALHGALWSGGSFVYVPKGVKVPMPLQIYFMMNYPGEGQFEHTLIIAEEGSEINYIEGCSAPRYDTRSVHSAVVEIFAKKGSRVRYTSIQNWSKNVYNLNTKRAIVYEDALMEWVGGTLGSGKTMLYPCSMLVGKGARAEHLNITFASAGQEKDNGAKVFHLAPNTTSIVVAKSIAKDGGWNKYRGLLKIAKGAVGAKANSRCEALLIDDKSRSDTYPEMDVKESRVNIGHEAIASRISQEQLFYLQSRGLTEQQAVNLIISGFIEPITKLLPLEYAVELNKLIELEMEGSVG